MAQTVKKLLVLQETRVQSLGWEDPLEEGMATHSSTLAWKIPRTEEPDKLQFMGWNNFFSYAFGIQLTNDQTFTF